MNEKPLGSSTPNYHLRVTSRRGVHSYNEEEILSPVTLNRSGTASPPTRSPLPQKREFLTASDVEDIEESDDEPSYKLRYRNSSSSSKDCSKESKIRNIERIHYKKTNDTDIENKIEQNAKQNNLWNKIQNKTMIGLLLSAFALLAYTFALQYDPEIEIVSLEAIQKEYPLQDEDFWLAVKSGVQEVIRFDKPSVFLFLYKENGESTTDRILTNISTYASCILNSNCNTKPIILSSEELNNNEILKKDSGYLLTTYKPNLETVRVMIVKNLENFPGYAAKVLHSFCDEISPAVSKSVFFLTIKVTEFPKTEVSYVRSLLREKWHDIKEDHFDPLFARISGMILSVKS